MTFEKLALCCAIGVALIITTTGVASPSQAFGRQSSQRDLPPIEIESKPFKTNRVALAEVAASSERQAKIVSPFQTIGFSKIKQAVVSETDFFQPVDSIEQSTTSNSTEAFFPEFMAANPFADGYSQHLNSQMFSSCITVKKNLIGCLENIGVLPQDEVWLVNARSCLCGETDIQLLGVSKLAETRFVSADIAELTQSHRSDPGKVTVMYVHGNQTNLEYAISRGMQVYRNAFSKVAECRQPIRFVIWAWKSEQEKSRLYPDFLVKSQRSVLLGDTFASTLNQFSDRRLLVFGYSLGVQVALSAFDSPLLQRKSTESSQYHVAFAAPAINADYVASHALSVGGRSPISQTFVFTNRKDRAIRAAQAIIRRKSLIDEPTVEGLARARKLDVGAVCTVEISDEAGPFHAIERYTRSSKLQTTMAALVNTVAASRTADLPAAEFTAMIRESE